MPSPVHSHIFLDESGDLGWKFNAPYRNGGSSRFLTIGYLICPLTEVHTPRRLVRDFYNKFNFDPKIEVKASDLKSNHKKYICDETVKLMAANSSYQLGSITVKKEKVHAQMRYDGNKLYNYMINLALLDKIEGHNTSKLTRDNRSIKVLSGKSLIDYLQTVVWYHHNKTAQLKDNPMDSHMDNGLIFIDWITNMVWSKYEDNYAEWCNILNPCLEDKKLYF